MASTGIARMPSRLADWPVVRRLMLSDTPRGPGETLASVAIKDAVARIAAKRLDFSSDIRWTRAVFADLLVRHIACSA